jgi:subtilisin family serine protease
MSQWLQLMLLSCLFWCLPACCQDRYFFQQGQSQLELKLDEPLTADSLTLRAELLPDRVQVRVRNQLILIHQTEFKLNQVPDLWRRQIQHIELIHVYQGKYLYLLKTAQLQHSLALLSWLQQQPATILVQPDLLPFRTKLRATDGAAAKPYLSLQHDAKQFNLYKYAALDWLWPKSKGKGVRIALIDSGFSFNHQALRQLRPLYSWDVDLNIPGAVAVRPGSHGDSVAGLIWARPMFPPDTDAANPLQGQAFGLAPEAGMIALKLTKPWTSQLLRAFVLAEQQQADVINLSWLLPWVAAPLQYYLHYLVYVANRQKGIVVVAAANPGTAENRGLAAMPELLVVSSTDHQGQLANARWDNTVDLAAVSYLLTVDSSNPEKFSRMAKTSASAPVVAAVVALLRAIAPDLTAAELELLLIESATKKEQMYADGQSQHYKILNVPAAVQQLSRSISATNRQ